MTSSSRIDFILRNWTRIAGASWVLSLALYVTLPPSPDQFSHAYMGWRLLEGDSLYRDLFDQNWPGVAWFHALAILIFGVNLWSWRLFDFIFFAATAVFLSDIIRYAINRDAARVCFLLLPWIYAGANYWIAGQHDMTAAQLLVVALWFHVRGEQQRNNRLYAVSGFFLALAVLNKPSVGVIALLLPLQTLWLRQPILMSLRPIAVMLTAASITLMLALLLVLVAGATLQNIFDLLYTFNVVRREVRNTSTIELGMRIWSLRHHPWWYPSLASSLPAFLWFLRQRSRTSAGFSLLALWLTGILSYLIQGSGVGYHLAPALLAMAAASSASVYLVGVALGSSERGALRRRIGQFFIAFVLAVIGAKLVVAYYTLPAAIIDGNSSRHLSRFPTGNGDVTVADTLDFIRLMPPLAPTDCILAVGNDSAISYLSKHRQPTRFYYFDVLVNTRPGLPMTDRWLEYWANDIGKPVCPIILIARHIVDHWLDKDGFAQESLRKLLEYYKKSGDLGAGYGTVIYIRASTDSRRDN